MAIALPIAEVASPANNTQTRVGDGSFNEELQRAIKILLDLFPSNLNLSIEKFNEPYKTSEQERETTNTNNNQNTNNPSTSLRAGESRITNNEQNLKIADVKAIKEALVKFMPNPAIPVFVGQNLGLDQSSSKGVSKIDLQSMIDKIVEQAKLIRTEKTVELSMLLYEKELGEISLAITSRNGLVSIQIAARQEAKKNLEDAMKDLELALKIAEVNVAQIKIVEVKDGSSSFS